MKGLLQNILCPLPFYGQSQSPQLIFLYPLSIISLRLESPSRDTQDKPCRHEKLWKLLNRLDQVDEHPTLNSCFLCLLFPLFVCFHQRSNEIGVEAMMVLEQSVSRGSPASKQVSAPAETSNALLHSASTHECPALLCSQSAPLCLATLPQ